MVTPLKFTMCHALSCSQLCTYYRTLLPLSRYVAIFLLNIYYMATQILFLFNLSVIRYKIVRFVVVCQFIPPRMRVRVCMCVCVCVCLVFLTE